MPEDSPAPLEHGADRPEDVTDPLLWKLALGVADAHGPDGNGGCGNLGCAGQSWPCSAWHAAQHALQVARAGTGTTTAVSPDLPRQAGEESRGGRPTELVRSTRRSVPENQPPTVTAPAA